MAESETAVAAAANAAASTAATIEAVQATAAAEVEAAVARADAAAATAQAVSDAAVATALGRQVTELEDDVTSWQEDHELEHQGLDIQIRDIVIRCDQMTRELAEAIKRLPTIVAVAPAPQPSPSILPASPEPEPTITVVQPTTVEPPNEPNENTPAEIRPKKRSWL